MSTATTSAEEANDKALEVLATYLTDEELVDFTTYNMQGPGPTAEDCERYMRLTNMHQHALYQLGLAMMESEVGGEGALEIFTDMLGMTEEALRQLREAVGGSNNNEEAAEAEAEDETTTTTTKTKSPGDAPEVGGGSPCSTSSAPADKTMGQVELVK